MADPRVAALIAALRKGGALDGTAHAHPLTPKELRVLISSTNSAQLHAIYAVGYLTAMRLGHVLRIKRTQ